MKDLAQEIAAVKVPEGAAALWWLGQAGFAFKAHDDMVIYVDPYLSNAVERVAGFKRLTLAPIDAEDVRADWVLSSHNHIDHLDTDSLPPIARLNPDCRFAGPMSCRANFDNCGIEPHRQMLLEHGGEYDLGLVRLGAVRADHGDLAPDALSFSLDFGEVRIVFTGDTALRMDWIEPLLTPAPDGLISCINGAYGNLNAAEAVQLTAKAQPRLTVPCHFWMFKEHHTAPGGDPHSFCQSCEQLCPEVKVGLFTPGEGVLVTADDIKGLS